MNNPGQRAWALLAMGIMLCLTVHGQEIATGSIVSSDLASPSLSQVASQNQPFLTIFSLGLMKEAIRSGKVEALEDLIEGGVDLHAIAPESGANILHILITSGFPEPLVKERMVRLLVEKGADVNRPRNEDGFTPLLLAAQNPQVASGVIAALLRHPDIDLNAQVAPEISGDGGKTALHFAVARPWPKPETPDCPENADVVEIVRMLLERGAKANIGMAVSQENGDFGGMTPLHVVATAEGDREAIVQLLLENGAKVGSSDASGRTPLHIALAQNKTKICQRLLEKGADIHAQDADGISVLDFARGAGKKLDAAKVIEK